MNASMAATIATWAHKGQLYGSVPYIDHCADVARRVTMDPRGSVNEIVVAWIHDIIEDTTGTRQILAWEKLRDAGLNDVQRDAMNALTRREGEDYSQYVARLALNPTAALVKLHDLESNLAHNPPERLERRYTIARQVMLQAVARHEARGAYVRAD